MTRSDCPPSTLSTMMQQTCGAVASLQRSTRRPTVARRESAKDVARCRSSAHFSDLVHVGCFVMAVNRDDKTQANRRIGRRHGNREGDEHVSNERLRIWTESPKGYEIEIRGIQHQLDANQHHDRVAAR